MRADVETAVPSRGGVGSWLRNVVLAGLVAVLPLFLTAWTLYVLFRTFDGLLSPIVSALVVHYLNASGLAELEQGTRIHGVGLAATFLMVLGTGLLVRNIVGRAAVASFEHLVLKVPVAGWVLSSARQLMGFFSRKRSFAQVALIEYPRDGSYAVAFVTGKADPAVTRALGGTGYTYVFVPSTPNPTGGILLIVPDDRIFPLNATVDEGIKLLVSAGILSGKQEPGGGQGNAAPSS